MGTGLSKPQAFGQMQAWQVGCQNREHPVTQTQVQGTRIGVRGTPSTCISEHDLHGAGGLTHMGLGLGEGLQVGLAGEPSNPPPRPSLCSPCPGLGTGEKPV